MSILPKLMKAYRDQGLTPLTGYNPAHFNGFSDAPFTQFLNQDKQLVGFLGLALQEIMFLESLGGVLSPKNILVIGNAHGWSTVALSLIFPQAKVVAIDPGVDGNALTNRIAAACGLNMRAVEGYSPQAVAPVVAEHLNGKPDLVLIDAVHTNEAIIDDFTACRAVASDDAIWLFHDVINCSLVDGVNRIREISGLTVQVLTRTASGITVAYGNAPQDFIDYVECFTDANMNAFRAYRRMAIDTAVDRLGGQIAKL